MKDYIILKIKNYDFLIKNNFDEFLLSIQLSRLINALRFVLKQFYTNRKDSNSIDRMWNIKNRYDLSIQLSGTLYEVIKTYKKDIELKINIDNLSENCRQKYNSLIQKYDLDKPSNFDNIIKDIRNKLLFHFDVKIVKDFFKNNKLNEDENYFLIGKSERIIDTFYCLPDDITLSFLNDKYFNGELVSNYGIFEDKVYNESLFFAEYFECLIIDLLKDHYYKTKEPL